MLPLRQTVVAVLLLVAANAGGQASGFRWITKATDQSVFRQVESAFKNELTPQSHAPEARTIQVHTTASVIERIGIRGTAALVILCEEGKKDDPSNFRAFNFDLPTKLKSPILGMGGSGFGRCGAWNV